MSNMFTRLMIPVGDMLEKARRKSPRLVPKFITMTNKKGTTYQKKVWVAPDEIDKVKPSFAQFDLFGDEPEEVKKEEPRKKSNVQDKLDEKYNEWEKTPCALLSSQVASAFETNGATARKFLDKKVESGEVVVWNQGKNKNYAIKGSEGEAFMLRQIARNKERESKRSGSDNIQIVFDVGSIYIGKENNEKWRGIYAGNGNFEITGASDSLGVNAGDLFKPTELNTIGFMGRKANYTPPKEVQTPLEQEVAKELGEDKPVKEKTPAKQEQREIDTPIAKTKFRDYGSWTANGKDLKPAERLKLNQEVAELILKPRNELTSEDKDKILRYSGFGGVKADDERGVLYDFYTSPPVAKMTFQMISKIMPIEKGSSILEPSCGTGVFFDVAPEGTELQGVELDTRTATVASIIQEKAKIATGSFEQFNLTSDKQFNFVVGNAPFGDRSITTSFMDMPEEKSLDRYFLTRSLDKLESGGTMGMIVHPGVMDNKTNREWRIEMIKKGQFKGAVRLPDKSFKHTQTQVQPDTIFFRKYPEEVARRLSELDEQGLKDAGFFDEEWVEGTYYENNPSSMIGENQVGAGNWGRDVLSGDLSASDMDRAVENFQPKPDKTVEHVEVLRSMTSGAGKKEKEKEIALLDPTEASAVAAKTLTVGMTKTVDGRVYVLNANHRWERVLGIDEEIAEKIKKVKAIAEKVIAIREAMQKGEPADNLQTEAREIIEEYEKEYGELPATDKDIRRVLNANKALNGVYEGLVNLTDDILTKQNIYEKDIDIVDGHNPAIVALTSLERQHIDATAEMIEKYFPNDIEALIAEMNSHQDVFLTENGVFQLREDFLAGNAWEKIDGLKKAIEENPGEEWTAERAKWEHGIEQLEKAVGWISIEDADFMPQSSWIPDDVIDRWAKDKNGLDDDNYKRMVYGNYYNDYHNAYKFLRRNEEGKWGITLNEDGEWQKENDPLVYFLNSQKQRSTNIDTAEYNERQADNFRNWVANDPETREQLEQMFNRSFNAEISGPTKTYAIKIDGWNPNIVLQPWQWQSVHKMYKEGKGISALGTGFGKTYAGIALLALLRQEGKVKRPFIQVPNNKVKDWKKYFNRAMPGLKIGVIDPEEAGYSNQVTRYKQYQDLANGDYDVLIFPETSASEIQLSQENDQLITESVVATQTLDKKEKSKRIQEGAKETARGKLAAGKTNKTISFEDLGCDAIMVDEAHRNKNLFTSTLSRETGLNDGRRSDRAMSLFKKNEFIRRNHDKKNVFFLTATPLTNSPLEYYNMLMHVAPEELGRLGINTIDEFINNFADIQQGFKYDWGSGKSKEGKVLKGFKNIRSLQDMFFKYTDLQNDPSKIGLIKPKANNHPNVIPMQEAQGAQLKKLAIELEAFKNATKEEREDSEDNYLTFYTKMRTASLDLELFDPVLYKGWKNEKIETMAQNSIDSYKATGGGQVVFCDRVMSGDASFNMHDKIKASMVAKGFKASEIVIVNGFTKGGGKQSDAAQGKSVSAAIEGFNAGKFKVIIGTTQTMGEGVNLQKNSAALHHLDIPYRPSDFIQRNGRVDRQGNKQGQVALHTYMAAGTIDNYSVGLVQGKANWIDQLLKTKSNVFVNPDDDSFVDPDELMLALTEEWGDKDQATERRAEMNRKKEEAIVTLNKEKAHNMLSTLSMMRGAIRSYTGDKGTIQYQNRLRKIDNLERGLSANPEFKNLDIISNDSPDFMYDKKNRDVYQPGDVFSNEYGMFEIESFKYNTSEVRIKRIEEFKKHYQSKDQITWKLGNSFPVGNIQPEVLKKPTEAMLNEKKAVFNPYLFTQQDNSFKKENYIEHIRASEHGSYIYKDKETGEIGLSLLGKYGMRSGIEILNPYDANDAKEIEKIYSQKELPSTYMIDEDEGINQDSGILDIVRNIKIEDYKRWKGSATIDKVITNEWQPVKAILEKVNKEIGGELEDYGLARNIEKHPGYETDLRREDGKYQNYFRKKQMEKSITGKSIYDVQLEPRLVLKIKRRS